MQALTFTPTPHQVEAGLAVTTAFDLTVSDVTALTPTTPTLLRTLSGGVIGFTSVATDAAGQVFVANSLNDAVEEFDASGVLTRTLSSDVSRPDRLATDIAGDAFVSNKGKKTIEEFDASGVLAHTISSGVDDPGGVYFRGRRQVSSTLAASQVRHRREAGALERDRFGMRWIIDLGSARTKSCGAYEFASSTNP